MPLKNRSVYLEQKMGFQPATLGLGSQVVGKPRVLYCLPKGIRAELRGYSQSRWQAIYFIFWKKLFLPDHSVQDQRQEHPVHQASRQQDVR